MHARLLALASLVMAPVALAAGNISQFPKKLGAPVEGSAVVVAEPTGAQVVFAGAGNKLHAFGLDGKPVPGFPLVLGPDEGVVGDVAAADMDGDGRAEVAVATKGGKLFLVSKGVVAAGFPVTLATGCAAGPSFGDLDGDNKPELLQGDRSGVLHVLKSTGAALAPFPLALGEALTSSPSVGRLQGQVAVAVGSERGKVYVLDSRGVMLAGFPLVTHFTVSGAPAFGDLDDDGKVDLVVASADFNLYAVSGTGEPLAGFPFTTQLALTGAPALADVDGDDVLDAVFTSTDGHLYAVGQGGKPLPGFPVKFESALPGGVAVGDLDRDGKPDLMVGTRDGKVHVVTAAGKKLPGSPQKVGSNPATPFLARLKDGAAVAFVGGADGELAGLRFDLKASGAPAAIAWAGAAHGASRSGRYFPNPLRYKDLAITPSPSRVEDTLKAAWTYFSIDGVAEPAPPIGWLRNGQRVKELDGKREVPPRTVKKGEKWRFELQVGQRVVKGPEVVIQDTPPTAPQVRVVPGSLSVKASAKLEVVTPSQDADGDKVTYKISWLLDGQNTNLTGEQLPAARLKKNQRWTAVVVPFDGELDGQVASTDATVANAPPAAPKLAMEPKAPRKGQVIAPVMQQAGPDPDGDAVQHRYRWTVNGVAGNFPLGQATLPVQSLRKGDTVALEVTAYDGKAEGDPWKEELKVVNTPPPAPKVAIVPAEPRAGQALRALVLAPSQDADADVVSYRAAWTRNGAPFAPAGDPFEVPVSEVKKGDKWAVTLTPNDGEADGAPGSASTTIRNTPPSLPLVKLEPEHPTTGGGITLVVVQPSKDVDGDTVTTNAVWTRDGKPVEDAKGAPRGQRAALAVNEFKKHEKVRVAMTPSDGAVEGQTGFYEVTIDNAVPGAPVVALEPSVPNNQAPLRAVIRTAAPDTDGDAIQYRYTWLKNGTPRAFPEAQAEVPAKELKKGDHWVVLVRAWDGEVLGPTARAATQIGNAPPPSPRVAIAPEAPRRGQELRALLTEAVDPDGEVLAYRYAWKRNGQAVQVGPQAAQVPHDLPRKGDAWSVEVIASDGQADSPVARAEVKVVNTVPTAPRLVLEPARPTTGGGISLKVSEASTDADGDPVKYSFAWTRDGAAVTGGEGKARQALTAKEFKKHEKVRVVATPNDGVADGPVAVAEVEVDDALPTAPVVAIEPATPTNQAPMKAVIRTPATDTDGDTLVYRYTWLRNGLRQAFPDSQAEVPASELKKGDRWTLVVRAWDGEALGPEAGASAQVGNATPPAPKVAILPGTPRRGEELRALLTEAVDPDADPLAYRYEWKRNGQPVPL
ncbi:MAG TPA: hypothetical protein VK447_17255, partial [Myxococcaceae bacterium]|nr:hypothetical protein [Myxococcaceae bacterium]